MKIKIKYVKTLSILLVLLSVQLTACSSKSAQESSQSASSQSDSKSEKIPSDLTELENNIEMIVKALDGPAIQTKQETQQSSESSQSGQSGQNNQSSESGQSSQSSQSSQSQQGSQSSQQGQEQKKSQPSSSNQQDPMVKISSIADKLHYQWNNLMPIAIKKGANKDLINNFDTALNNLSSTIISKNKINTMVAANKLYANIPELYQLFESKSSTEIKRVRYYSRNAILNSLTADWTKADADIGNLKSVWVLYKSSINKDQQEIANKLDLSIYELEKVIKEKNKTLVNIKGKVEFSNIESLENKSEESSGSQQSS